jgi:PIN domain nuclease of toxin-antitoxin system
MLTGGRPTTSSREHSVPDHVVELLLDSHVAVWWAVEPERLSPGAAQALRDPQNALWVSAASAWELAIKVGQGKLELDVRDLFERLVGHGVRLRGIGVDDGVEAAELVWPHRDPFDRMLVAQARRSALTIVTRDDAIRAFVAGALAA